MVSEEQIEAGAAVLAKGRLLDNKYAQRAIVEKIYLAMSQASPIEDGCILGDECGNSDRIRVMREALENIAGHDASANGLSGFAWELVEQLTGIARSARASEHKGEKIMPKKQSTQELSSLAAQFLNESDDEAYQASPDDRWLDLVKLARRFAASVLSQDEKGSQG